MAGSRKPRPRYKSVTVRRPSPGLLMLDLPYRLTKRADGLDIPFYGTFTPQPEHDHALLGELVRSIRKTSVNRAGLTIDGAYLCVYRSVGRMPRKCVTPPQITDFDVLTVVRETTLAVTNTALRFVHPDTGMHLNSNDDLQTLPLAR